MNAANDATPRGLYANETRRDLGARRSIKLRLPLHQHIRLHALRLHKGDALSDTVEQALDLYFERVRAEGQAAAAPGANATYAPAL